MAAYLGQVGADLVSLRMASGHVDKIGVFFAYAQAAGDLSGLAVGRQQSVGHERINGYGVGGYWTHAGPTGWYVDSVLTGLWFDGNATSDFGTGINTSRNSLVASVEGGYPIPHSSHPSLGPHAQLIWQHLSLST